MINPLYRLFIATIDTMTNSEALYGSLSLTDPREL